MHGPSRARARARTLIRFALCLLLALTACAPPLRVGSSGDYPPFSARAVDGSWSGFDVEVARAWARDRGRRLVLVPVRWPDLEATVERHEIDVAMSGVTVRADRLLAGRFGSAVAQTSAVLVARPGTSPPARVAVNRGGHLERLARARLPASQLTLVEDNRRLRGVLDAGAVDGIVTDTLELRAIAPDLAAKGFTVTPLSDDRKAYFLPADAAALQNDLDAWLALREGDGWLPALRSRLLGDGTPSPPPAAVARVTDLIARRLMLMPAVAAAKRASGMAIVDPSREAEVENRAVARAAGAGLAPEPYRALVRAQIAAAIAVQRAAGEMPQPPSLPLVRAAIDRIDEALLPALLDAVPITTPADVLSEAVKRDAGVPGLSNAVLASLAQALRGLARSPVARRGVLPGIGPSAKLGNEEGPPMAKAIWHGAVLAESDHTERVEGNHYFPPFAVHKEYLRESATHSTCPWKGVASYYDVVVDGETNHDAAWYYPAPKDAATNIRDHVAFWRGVQVEP